MPDNAHQEALLASIRQAAQAERDTIEADTQAEIAQIESQADAKVAAIEANARDRATHTADLENDRAVTQTEAQTRRALARKKRQLLDEAFALAQAELESHGQNDATLNQRLLDQAVAALGPQAQGSAETATAHSADGRRRIDNRLQTRLERVQSLHSQDIAGLLFGASSHE